MKEDWRNTVATEESTPVAIAIGPCDSTRVRSLRIEHPKGKRITNMRINTFYAKKIGLQIPAGRRRFA